MVCTLPESLWLFTLSRNHIEPSIVNKSIIYFTGIPTGWFSPIISLHKGQRYQTLHHGTENGGAAIVKRMQHTFVYVNRGSTFLSSVEYDFTILSAVVVSLAESGSERESVSQTVHDGWLHKLMEWKKD